MSIKVTIHIFALALTVSETLTFKMLDLDNLGQVQNVQHLPWPHSLKYQRLYKS